ncbi:MAG: oxygen-independent coproporphyrinogen III oxidase-like protein, partial [Gammaproteobacteria bacterium]|nr:oxygen-independent coproporphyrinogen III oxidase-like protein [Gammaproteobacteria bacterium]
RIHGPEQVIHAVSQARAGGFENINLDLMFGLPGQSLEESRCDVEVAIELEPEHISYYQLTIEPNTQFAVSPPVLPSDERLWDIQQQGQALLDDGGYRQYEISAYSMADKQCRHNLNYWNFGDYLGIGAGAHGKISDSENQRVRRRSRVRGPALYLKHAGSKQALSGDVYINEQSLMLEFMMNLLRLNAGFNEALFQDRTGVLCARVQPILLKAQQRGLLQLDCDRLKPTQLGHRYLNDLLGLFV